MVLTVGFLFFDEKILCDKTEFLGKHYLQTEERRFWI